MKKTKAKKIENFQLSTLAEAKAKKIENFQLSTAPMRRQKAKKRPLRFYKDAKGLYIKINGKRSRLVGVDNNTPITILNKVVNKIVHGPRRKRMTATVKPKNSVMRSSTEPFGLFTPFNGYVNFENFNKINSLRDKLLELQKDELAEVKSELKKNQAVTGKIETEMKRGVFEREKILEGLKDIEEKIEKKVKKIPDIQSYPPRETRTATSPLGIPLPSLSASYEVKKDKPKATQISRFGPAKRIPLQTPKKDVKDDSDDEDNTKGNGKRAPTGGQLQGENEGKGKALYDDELVNILAPYKDFVGVIMRDELGGLLKKMKELGQRKFGFVINTDKSNKNGEHWQAIYVDLDEGKEVCFYDSYGDEAHKSVKDDIKKYIEDVGLPYMLKWKENRICHQSDKSNRCGFHSARFLIDMFRGRGFPEATDFNQRAEGDAKEMEERYRAFGYV